MSKVVFCVAGMHRSGSSLFANWLYNCDVFIGEELLGAASTNSKGHFEDLDFLRLHSDELQKNGLHPSGLYGRISEISVSELFHQKAFELVEKRRSKDMWGWKEPRTTLFLDEWLKIIPNLKVIVLHREEEKVINSLYSRLKKNKWYVTRNPLKKIFWYLDIDLRKGKWRRVFKDTCTIYNEKCETLESKHPEHILNINLDTFIKRHAEEVLRINKFLGTALPDHKLDTVFESHLLS